MRTSKLLAFIAFLPLVTGCAPEGRSGSPVDAKIIAAGNYALKSLGEPAVCSIEATRGEGVFRMIRLPADGSVQVVSVRARGGQGTATGVVAVRAAEETDKLDVVKRATNVLSKKQITQLWFDIDVSRLWEYRTGLDDVEDGVYVIFDGVGLWPDCRHVTLLSPDSVSTMALIEHMCAVGGIESDGNGSRCSPPPS